FVFFFSSRRRHTRWPRDWSSDVCSSDLVSVPTLFSSPKPPPDAPEKLFWRVLLVMVTAPLPALPMAPPWPVSATLLAISAPVTRSEERRVGKGCRARWAGDQ